MMDSDHAAIFRKLAGVVEDFFNVPIGDISPDTTPEDVDGWDSIAHVSFLIELERAFGVEISPEDSMSVNDLGGLVQVLAAKLDRPGAGDGTHAGDKISQ